MNKLEKPYEETGLVQVDVEGDSDTAVNDSGFDLNDETITQEQINEMKMLGAPRPPGVSSERWWRLQDIRYEHEFMIHMAATGLPQKQIAEQLGYEMAHVSKVLNTPDVKERISEEISKIYGADVKKALKDRALKAVGVVDKILLEGKETEQASMAKWVLEHTVGKPSQEVNVNKTTLSQVILQIDQMKQNGQLRDVGSSTDDLQNSKDHFDTIIEQVIPQGMVVGKRSEGTDEGQS